MLLATSNAEPVLKGFGRSGRASSRVCRLWTRCLSRAQPWCYGRSRSGGRSGSRGWTRRCRSSRARSGSRRGPEAGDHKTIYPIVRSEINPSTCSNSRVPLSCTSHQFIITPARIDNRASFAIVAVEPLVASCSTSDHPHNRVICAINRCHPRGATSVLSLFPRKDDLGRTCRCNFVGTNRADVVMKGDISGPSGVIRNS
jgi:hypothetical protein